MYIYIYNIYIYIYILETRVSSSLIKYPIKKALCHTFSDESNKLETYIYITRM